MALKKDDYVTVTIEDIGTSGEGIGKADGYTLFIKDAIIGDVVEAKVMKAKKNYGYARLMKLVTPSKDRVKPQCPVARQCGGCQIQEMSYESQLKFKQDMVKNNLERIGGLTEYQMYPIIGMDHPFHYRNKAQFPVGADVNGSIITGFYAGRTHYIVDNMDCCIGSEVNEQILKTVKEYMIQNHVQPYHEADHTGLIRHILIRTGYHTDEIMVCLVLNGKKLPAAEALVQSLQKINHMTSIMMNINTEKTNVILGRECSCLWGRSYIEDYICDIKYQISPLSFFQVNPQQTEKLYAKALEYADLHGSETVWDLYCGIGTISLFLAGKAKKVYGVEIVPQAIEDAKNNAKINEIDNVEFFVGKAEEVVPAFYQDKLEEQGESTQNQTSKQSKVESQSSIHPDVIVVDPPRKGCDERLLDTMIKMQPKRIVYVSCDSATMARDVKMLVANGYNLKKVQPVDQFAHSVHVETVALLERQ